MAEEYRLDYTENIVYITRTHVLLLNDYFAYKSNNTLENRLWVTTKLY